MVSIWTVKNKLNAKSINDPEQNSGNMVDKRQDSRPNILAGMEEYVVEDSTFHPSPQFLDYVDIWTVGREKFQAQSGIFLKKSCQ